ncbi:hypothetical protein [Sorangium sp. So ce854]|uniref:Vgb family protein n=1 Tax=Sorangium sp. So ce854 TaxID=3133322 RepID=UPI003F63D2AC
MRTSLISLLCLSLAACSEGGSNGLSPEPSTQDLIFTAVEDDGTLAVLDADTGALLRTVDLSLTAHGAPVKVAVHNVQAAPDGRTVWLTAMPISEDGGHAGGEMDEELVGVDIAAASVVSRISLGAELHAAHVVISGTTAYVTANEADAVLVVDLAAERVARTIQLPDGTGPHGARLTPDGRLLIVAGMGDGSLVFVETGSDDVTRYDLPGRVVQTAVLPNGRAALATIYDTRQVARIDLSSREVELFDLPSSSAGPAQLYPSPDSRFVWVADQGMLDGDPAGRSLIAMDATTGQVHRSATVDPGPHGVVLNERGTKVWTTTVVNGTVQAIDTSTGAVLSTADVGNEPNGISYVHEGGVMP